uniref:Uncharacterized protein n=1 Tax=Kalanchoe fedtschenkoi TaxID=63787 RepID=A0A7N0TMW7_KALFE
MNLACCEDQIHLCAKHYVYHIRKYQSKSFRCEYLKFPFHSHNKFVTCGY